MNDRLTTGEESVISVALDNYIAELEKLVPDNDMLQVYVDMAKSAQSKLEGAWRVEIVR